MCNGVKGHVKCDLEKKNRRFCVQPSAGPESQRGSGFMIRGVRRAKLTAERQVAGACWPRGFGQRRSRCEATRRARFVSPGIGHAHRNANTQLCMGRGLRQRALETRDSRNWPRRRFQGLGALGQNMRICATCLPSSAGRPLLVLFTRDVYPPEASAARLPGN